MRNGLLCEDFHAGEPGAIFTSAQRINQDLVHSFIH